MMLSICLFVCPFVRLSTLPRSDSLSLVAVATKGVPMFPLLWKNFPREIYGCGMDLIVASINAPHVFMCVVSYRSKRTQQNEDSNFV